MELNPDDQDAVSYTQLSNFQAPPPSQFVHRAAPFQVVRNTPTGTH